MRKCPRKRSFVVEQRTGRVWEVAPQPGASNPCTGKGPQALVSLRSPVTGEANVLPLAAVKPASKSTTKWAKQGARLNVKLMGLGSLGADWRRKKPLEVSSTSGKRETLQPVVRAFEPRRYGNMVADELRRNELLQADNAEFRAGEERAGRTTWRPLVEQEEQMQREFEGREYRRGAYLEPQPRASTGARLLSVEEAAAATAASRAGRKEQEERQKTAMRAAAMRVPGFNVRSAVQRAYDDREAARQEARMAAGLDARGSTPATRARAEAAERELAYAEFRAAMATWMAGRQQPEWYGLNNARARAELLAVMDEAVRRMAAYEPIPGTDFQAFMEQSKASVAQWKAENDRLAAEVNKFTVPSGVLPGVEPSRGLLPLTPNTYSPRVYKGPGQVPDRLDRLVEEED